MLVAFVFFLKSTKKVFPKLNGWLKTKKVRPKPHLSYDLVRLPFGESDVFVIPLWNRSPPSWKRR